MCDPAFSAVEDIIISVFDSGALHAHSITSRIGFSQAPGSNPFTCRELGNPFAPLFLVAKCVDMVSAQRIMSCQGKANRSTDFCDFSDDGDIFLISKS